MTLAVLVAASLAIAADHQPAHCDVRPCAVARPPQECTGAAHAPRLDHAIIAVRDLDAAASAFRSHGFRLKNGRLHANNLLNRHVKFRDGTSIELMTVRGTPGDAMAADYADLIAAGEGGVYVALTATNIDAVARIAAARGLAVQRSSSGPWRFVGFPAASPAAALFFNSGGAPVQDPDSLVSHEPAVNGLLEVWVEGDEELGGLLEALGAQRCGTTTGPDGRTGERFGLGRGSLVITRHDEGVRPRVLGAVLRSTSNARGPIRPHSRFWITYRPAG